MAGKFDDETLVIALEKSGQEIKLPYLNHLDTIKFEWDEYHCGDRDEYYSEAITIEELYGLLTMNKNDARVLADEVLRKELQAKEGKVADLTRTLEARNKEVRTVRAENELLRKAIKIVEEG